MYLSIQRITMCNKQITTSLHDAKEILSISAILGDIEAHLHEFLLSSRSLLLGMRSHWCDHTRHTRGNRCAECMLLGWRATLELRHLAEITDLLNMGYVTWLLTSRGRHDSSSTNKCSAAREIWEYTLEMVFMTCTSKITLLCLPTYHDTNIYQI